MIEDILGLKRQTARLKLSMIVLILFIFVLVNTSFAELKDQHENCNFWAQEGECEKNPGYMLENCAKSCSKKSSPAIIPNSIYDIKETTINGNVLDFNVFRNKVLYIVNVASYCGYTEENYALFRKFADYITAGLEIIIAPCNQFGSQEPGTSEAIQAFTRKNNFQGIILSKADVNGEKTRPLFAYLKKAANKPRIDW